MPSTKKFFNGHQLFNRIGDWNVNTEAREAPPSRAARKTTAKRSAERSSRPTVKLDNPVHRIRLRNVQELIEKRFGGNATQLARAIGKSNTYLWQLLHLERRIGENTARHMEQALELEQGQLDKAGGSSLRPSLLLIQHMGDGRTRRYRMCPMATLDDFDAKPSAKPDDLRPCPIGTPEEPKYLRCSESTVWIKYTNTTDPRYMNGTMFFVDRNETELADRALYVVRPLNGPLKGRAMLREARRDEGGWVLRSLNDGSSDALPEKHVKILGRAIYAVEAL